LRLEYNVAMRKRKEVIHPQLRDGFVMLYDELRGEGLSDEEAYRRLMTDFDWSLRELRKRNLVSGLSKPLDERKDEFARTEKSRIEEAENETDLAALWLEAREKGDGSHLIIELMIGIRSTGS
jgi:hypothetical protein